MEQDYRNSDEHIYENVTRYKYNKILNGIFNSFTLKPKRDKLPTPSSSPSPSIHRSAYDDMSACEFYENSYTSCEDDNIYENLEFFDAYDDDNFLHIDCALNEWMRNLSHDIDDYETDNYIFIKSIPSVLQSQCASTHRSVSKSEITLNFLKSLWREDRVGMMSFLLETFSNLLRLQKQPQHTTIMESPSIKKRKKSSSICRQNYQQKLEHVILSSSLNSLMITYNKSLKFYFALSQRSETFSLRLSTGDVNVAEVLATIRRNFKLKFDSRSERKEFYVRLKLVLDHKLSEIDQLSAPVELRENCENIYQPIWTCQSSTDKRSAMVICENIYAQVMTTECVARDDHEWEIDDEFSFMTSMMITNNHNDAAIATMTAASSAYKTVWILYSDENCELNRIIYDQNLFMQSLNSPSNCNSQSESPLSENKLLISRENMKISEQFLKPVEQWKSELRMPCNMEDEEDFFVTDSILQINFCGSNESSKNNSNISLESDAMCKSVYDDAMSTSFHLGDTLMATKSLESFRSAISTDELESMPADSPRKDRLRDKVLLKLRLKSSKTVNISDQSLNESTKGEDEELERHKVFGCNLEIVDKDGYYKEIPKFVVECVRFLEIESNLRTPGIYRISGNKTVMDGIKKKMNDKKPPKKESTKYSCLQDQDVHTLTGLLKTFFRELNPPLMPKEIFESCTSEKLTSIQMKEKLKEMPALNYALLRYLFKHFKSVERYAKENSMSSGNLAICCGIGLFSGGDDINPFDNDIGKCNMLCKFLIDNFREVFD